MAYVVSLLPDRPEGDADERGKETLDDLREALEEQGPVEDGEPGRLIWSCGQSRLEVCPAAGRDGRIGEIEVRLPFGALADEATEALEKLIEAAEKSGLVVFDPQLGRSVSRADVGSITSRFLEASSYHQHYSGVSEDARQGMASASEYERPPLLSSRAKALILFVGALIVFYMFFRITVIDSVLDSLSPSSSAELERPEGPPPGWLDRHVPGD